MEGAASGREACDRLAAAARNCSATPTLDNAEATARCLAEVLHHGLQRSRTPWSVVRAMGRAYPLLLDKGIQQAERGAAAAAGTDPAESQARHDETCMQAWALQAVTKGLCGPFLHKLTTQPQVLSAYAPDALARDKATLKELAAVLQPLQEPLSKLSKPAPPETAAATGAAEPAAMATPAPAQPPPASEVHIETDEEVLAAKQKLAEANKLRRQRPWWGSSKEPAPAQEANSSGTEHRPNGCGTAGGEGEGSAAAVPPFGQPQQGKGSDGTGGPSVAVTVPTAAAAAAAAPMAPAVPASRLLPFTLWGTTSSSSGAAAAAAAKAAPSAPSAAALQQRQQPDLTRSKSAPRQPSGNGGAAGGDVVAAGGGDAGAAATGRPLRPSGSQKGSDAGAAPDATGATSDFVAVTFTIAATADSNRPVAVTLTIKQQQAAGSAYGSWATLGTRLLPWGLWGPASGGGASATAMASGAGAPAAVPGTGVGSGQAAAAGAAVAVASSSSRSGAAVPANGDVPGPIALEIHYIRPLSDDMRSEERPVAVTLTVRPAAPPPEAALTTAGWVYGAAARLVDQGAWAYASSLALSATTAPRPAAKSSIPTAAPPALADAATSGSERPAGGSDESAHKGREVSSPSGLGGDSDEDSHLGVLEDLKLVLAGTFDGGHDHGYEAAHPTARPPAASALPSGARRLSGPGTAQAAPSGLGPEAADGQPGSSNTDVGGTPLSRQEQQQQRSVRVSQQGSSSAQPAASAVEAATTVPQLQSSASDAQGSLPGVQQSSSSSSSSSSSAPPAFSASPQDGVTRTAAAGGTEPSRGMTVRLHFDLVPACSKQQQHQKQGGLCAGCQALLPDVPAPGKAPPAATGGYFWAGVASPAVQAARLCGYTGKLYCSHCHQQQTSVIPGRVLHKWDFVPRPVSCAAHDYLTSISDQPVLCVTAINPGLYAKVPQLAEAHGLRQRIRAKLAAARAAGQAKAVMAMKQAAGSRAYLLGEMEDFFSLSDLIDLSKGALSQLSTWLAGVEAEAAALASQAGTRAQEH